jgi:gliding motility-associated-like protein
MRTINALLFFYLLLVIQLGDVRAQDRSNRGKEFWLCYGYNWGFTSELPINAQELAIYISTEQAATVTVSVFGTTWSRTLNIPANTVDASILIPKSGADDARILTDGMSTKGIRISSDVPVAVYAHQYNTMLSGATMLMPLESLGYSYYSINYSQATSNSALPSISPTTGNGPDWYSWFAIISTEDGTRVQITPSDTTKNGWLPGQTYTVDLNKGEVYTVFGKMIPGNSLAYAASKDMTGTKVISVPGATGQCRPIAFFSGSSGIRICRGDGGEFMQQQVFPAQAWGTRYLTFHTINNTNTDINETNRNYYRICVQDPTTVVRRNGIPLTGLQRNFFYEIMDSTGGDYITADKPILVSQYMVNENQCWRFPTTTPAPPSYGDPEMFYISPIEQGQKSVRFYVSRKSTIDYVYANIHIPLAAIPSLRVDGNPVPATNVVTHPNLSSHAVALTRFTGPAAEHIITADSAFTATVYGLGSYESYGYNVGTLINNLNHYGAISNTLNTTSATDTFTCTKTPVRLFIKLGYPARSILWKLSQVGTMTPTTDSLQTNPSPIRTEFINGRIYYVYTLQQDFIFNQPGNYTIPITYTADEVENCSRTEFAQINVVVRLGPIADFSYSSNNCVNESVQFTGITSSGLFTISGHSWIFPDNSTSNTRITVKQFPTVGNVNIRYRVVASNGCVGDTARSIPIGIKPVVDFSFTGKPCVDSIYRLSSTALTSGGNTEAWFWDFGNTQSFTSSSQSTSTISYSTPATNVQLKHWIKAISGCNSDTITKTIPTIRANPIADFTITPALFCTGMPLTFTSSLTNINQWNWNFGTTINNGPPPVSYTYTSTGTAAASLQVVDNAGCGSAINRRSFNVLPAPPISAGPDKTIITGASVQLEASISNPIFYQFQWTPTAFLSDPRLLQPVATPSSTTRYIISATDSRTGCSAADSVQVGVFTDLFIPTAFTPNRDGKNDTWEIPGLAMYPSAKVLVFERAGQVVFESSNYIPPYWDGSLKGKLLPIGVYVYMIQLNDAKKTILKGTLTIIY